MKANALSRNGNGALNSHVDADGAAGDEEYGDTSSLLRPHASLDKLAELTAPSLFNITAQSNTSRLIILAIFVLSTCVVLYVFMGQTNSAPTSTITKKPPTNTSDTSIGVAGNSDGGEEVEELITGIVDETVTPVDTSGVTIVGVGTRRGDIPGNMPRFCRTHADQCEETIAHHYMYEIRHSRIKAQHFERTHKNCTYLGTPANASAPIKVWQVGSYPADVAKINITNCPVDIIIYTHDRDRPLADILIDEREPRDDVDRSRQKSAIYSIDSFRSLFNAPGVHPMDNETAQAADFLITFELRSDATSNYWYGINHFQPGIENVVECEDYNRCLYNYLDKRRNGVLPYRQWDKLHEQEAVGSVFVSNCINGRKQYVEELMKILNIHSYADCLRTPGLPTIPRGAENKLNIISQYQFYFAFENSIYVDYVTEKYWEGWQSGVLMIYWGAPNIIEYQPAPHSFVNALDYDGPKELAEHLLYLRSNRTAYEEYFLWRRAADDIHDAKLPEEQQPKNIFLPSFLEFAYNNTVSIGERSYACRIAQRYAERYCVQRPPWLVDDTS